MTSLTGSTILVCGASGVLGGEIARLLAAEGADLVLTGRDRGRLEALGLAATIVAADLTDPAAADALIRQALEAHGALDGIVNASGVVAFGAATEISDGTLDALFAVNVLAPMRLLRAAIAPLTASAAAGREPFVLTLSGVVSEVPTANMAAYSASKAALAAWGKATGRELRRAGIRVLDARPGHTETGLVSRALEGAAPKLAPGLDPAVVARRIVAAIISGERDLPSSAFTDPAAD
ncbi:SDR family NAD(P)-dependent oxidoreductase [Cryobacterium melibiosiphilum]|uniref:SDR family NAD(P)-dependent oxidoreductase n=1 Tax=Cryobacterium melibiosiphilum TaxID=995039 RepID=A0A3A5MQK1_9MICO|nr:SDR family NAD(P)-dependent oxidoreductase [Cryobacterium melibiosiphilum]RJT90099.1 SDR family NAD(P)-dependent oxidoreductase [Cryobacterium melibiosiphilum]